MLISEKHRQLYVDHYAANPVPEIVRKHSWHDFIQKLVMELEVVNLLDYGSGPSKALETHIKCCNVWSYDPGVADLAHVALSKFDLVVCSHTLEHTEVEYVPDIIAELGSLADKALLIVVSLKDSTKLLPDGTPWHTCVRSAEWWSNQFDDLYRVYVEPPCRPGEYAALWRA